MSATPRVRVVVVDHDGGDLTVECLRSLAATEWPAAALEVVLVDNASQAPVTDRVRAELPAVRTVASPENRGFGAGCNLGIALPGAFDHVALVNNDVTVDPGWLAPLVATLAADPRIGAACPKILLRDRFRAVTLEAATARRRADRRSLGVRVSGADDGVDDLWTRIRFAEGFWGDEPGPDGTPGQWTGNGPRATLLVPDTGRPVALEVAALVPTTLRLDDTAGATETLVGTMPLRVPLPGGAPARDVLHNVGVEPTGDGYFADRGELTFDDGRFDEPTDVFAWCGGGVLLSGAYLADVGTFDERLFLYYEDVDLAWRGRRRGWRYRSAPTSVLRHVHAATSRRNATRTLRLNERNHLLVLARDGDHAATARATWHHARATASYALRDVVGPALRGERPHGAIVGTRLRALAGFAASAPRFVRGA